MKEGVQALFARKNNNPAPAPKQPAAKTRSEAEEKVLDEKPKRAPSMRTPLGPSSYRGRPAGGRGKEWSAERSYYTSNAYDKQQYEELRTLAYKENVPIKEIIYQFLRIGLEAFKNGEFNFDYYRQ